MFKLAQSRNLHLLKPRLRFSLSVFHLHNGTTTPRNSRPSKPVIDLSFLYDAAPHSEPLEPFSLNPQVPQKFTPLENSALSNPEIDLFHDEAAQQSEQLEPSLNPQVPKKFRSQNEGGDISSNKRVEMLHPWPEWVELMDKLWNGGYFDKTGNPFGTSELGSKDFNKIRTACLNFARHHFDVIWLLSREDIEVVAGAGCPSLDRRVVNSGKRLRAYVGIDEGNVCSSCVLRGNCLRANMMASEDVGGRTVDVMRILLTYGLDVLIQSVENKACLNTKVNKSVRKLLKEVVAYSSDGHNGEEQLTDSKHKLRAIKDTPTKQSDWSCPKCNFLNFARNVKCLQCEGSAQERLRELNVEQADLPLKKGDWICYKCNILNFARNMRCLLCKEKPSNRKIGPGEWECDSCNYINFRRNSACLKCDHQRPKSMNYAPPAPPSQPITGDNTWHHRTRPYSGHEKHSSRDKGGDRLDLVGNDEDYSTPENDLPGFFDFPGGWKCDSCNHINLGQNTACIKCDHQRPKSMNYAPPSSQHGDNTRHHRTRSSFGQEKHSTRDTGGERLDLFGNDQDCSNPKKGSPGFDFRGEWKCDLCNYINLRQNSACMKCDHQRPKSDNHAPPPSQPITRDNAWHHRTRPYIGQENHSSRGKRGDRLDHVSNDQAYSNPEKDFPGGWKCDSCNHINWRQNTACMKCDHQRLKSENYAPPPQPITGDNKWHHRTRPYFGHENHSSRDKGGDRSDHVGNDQDYSNTQKDLPEFFDFHGEWKCDSCSHINLRQNAACMKCDHQRPKSMNYAAPPSPPITGDNTWHHRTRSSFGHEKHSSRDKGGERLDVVGNDQDCSNPKKDLPGEWKCDSCNYINFRRNTACLKCDHQRPKSIHYAPAPPQSQPITRPSFGLEKQSSVYKGDGRLDFFGTDQDCSNLEKDLPGFFSFPIKGGKGEV